MIDLTFIEYTNVCIGSGAGDKDKAIDWVGK